jgi:hypothetical protein
MNRLSTEDFRTVKITLFDTTIAGMCCDTFASCHLWSLGMLICQHRFISPKKWPVLGMWLCFVSMRGSWGLCTFCCERKAAVKTKVY